MILHSVSVILASYHVYRSCTSFLLIEFYAQIDIVHEKYCVEMALEVETSLKETIKCKITSFQDFCGRLKIFPYEKSEYK
jgi:hypothetical protein